MVAKSRTILFGGTISLVDGLNACRDILDSAHDSITSLDSAQSIVTEELRSNFGEELSSESVEAAAKAIVQILDEVRSERKAAEEANGSSEGDDLDASTEAPSGSSKKLIDAVNGISPSVYDTANFVRALGLRFRRSPSKSVMFRSSLLVVAVTNFEVFFRRVVRVMVEAHPDVIKADEDKFSWSQLTSYDSIEEFKEFYLDKQIEKTMRGGFDSWVKWLGGNPLRLKLADVTDNPVKLKELFERRHLHVHTAGRVSRQYLEEMNGAPDLPAIGKFVPVSEEYLREAIDRLELFGMLIALMVGHKLKLLYSTKTTDGSKADFASAISNPILFEELKRGNYAMVGPACSLAAELTTSEYTRQSCRVNSWIARKEQEGLDSIRHEVEEWQTGHLGREFQLAKLALLDQLAEAHALAEELIESDTLTRQALQTWPLLRYVRSTQRP